MIRGLEGKEIFYDDEDRENFLYRLGQLAKEAGDVVHLIQNFLYKKEKME
jgi:hypothetical protein